MPDPIYSVLLKADLPSTERELLRRYCHEIHGTDGSTLLHFLCSRIETSHPVYLELDAMTPRRGESRHIRVPHTYVFLIDDDGESLRTDIMKTPALPDH